MFPGSSSWVLDWCGVLLESVRWLRFLFGKQGSATVNICEFFDSSFSFGTHSFAAAEIVFSFQGSVLLAHSRCVVCLGEEELFFIGDIRRRCYHLKRFCLYVFRDFRRIFSVILSSSLKIESAAALTEPTVCAFLKLNCNAESQASHKAGGIAFVVEETCDWFVFCQGDCWFFLCATKYVPTRELPKTLMKMLSTR